MKGGCSPPGKRYPEGQAKAPGSSGFAHACGSITAATSPPTKNRPNTHETKPPPLVGEQSERICQVGAASCHWMRCCACFMFDYDFANPMRAIFKRARQRSWPCFRIVHGASNKQPANGTNHIRLAPKRTAAHSAKRPIMVPKHWMAANRQNDQPQRQERYRFNHPEKHTPNQRESICGHTSILAERGSLNVELREPQSSA